MISRDSNIHTGARTSEFGVLWARDDAFLYIHRPDGQVAVLPLQEVQSMEVIDPPESGP